SRHMVERALCLRPILIRMNSQITTDVPAVDRELRSKCLGTKRLQTIDCPGQIYSTAIYGDYAGQRTQKRQRRAAHPCASRRENPPRLRNRQTHRRALRGRAPLSRGSLYPLLYRLERRGWVKGEWEPAGGRRRRY